ncbi:MAG TPA: energy transducer TonB [Myxococcales bacterium]|nr:energy transducer TonB [Myxococcales bacterium]
MREKSREEKLAEEKATVSRRIEGWFSDEKARQRARTDRDAYWQAVEDGLRRGFDPGWDVVGQGPNVPKSRLGVFLDTWQKQAASYGATGNPFAGVPGAPGTVRPLHQEFTALANEDRGLRGVSFNPTVPIFDLVFAGAPTGGQPFWPNSLVALVRITLREDGSLFGAELAGSSGNPAYDRLALGKARSVGKLALRPPALVTLWAFETDFAQAPPLPIAGCALDDFVPKNCWAPLQRRVRSRVRLMAIY